MNIASIITYIIAIVSYLGLIIFAVVGLIRAYRSVKTEYMVYHRQVVDKLNGIEEKLHHVDLLLGIELSKFEVVDDNDKTDSD